MKQAYQTLINAHKLSKDKAQLKAVDALSLLAHSLESRSQKQPNNQKQINLKHSIKGLYFHGRVGRGKTMLMDMFYQHVEIKQKQRVHFHRFMESIHLQLNKLTVAEHKIDNPLNYIAKLWAEEVHLLCFDEFFISDIADAMLIGGLLTALFNQGVILVATSNCQPEQLYQNGLLRERFLPTITLINQYCDVISVDGVQDHRLVQLQKLKEVNEQGQSSFSYFYYYFPLLKGNAQLNKKYHQLIGNDDDTCELSTSSKVIIINQREIPFIHCNSKTICFDFFDLCSGPRSQRDYMEIADKFTCVFIRNVPQFSGKPIPAVFSGVEDSYQRSGVLMGDLRQLDDEARRFIALVDEFYDQKIKLIISAEVDIPQLYQGKQLAFEFARCQSRLFEMQSA